MLYEGPVIGVRNFIDRASTMSLCEPVKDTEDTEIVKINPADTLLDIASQPKSTDICDIVEARGVEGFLTGKASTTASTESLARVSRSSPEWAHTYKALNSNKAPFLTQVCDDEPRRILDTPTHQ